jgi:Mg-chelatase subunit ChlD
MNPENKSSEQEARITALLLGELAPTEAAELTAAIEADPELRRMRDRLRQTMDLVREATSAEAVAESASPIQPRLTESRRSELLKRFRVVDLPQVARERSWSWTVPIAAAAGLTLVLSVLSLSVGSAWRTVIGPDAYTALAKKYSEGRLAERLRESAGRDFVGTGAETEGAETRGRKRLDDDGLRDELEQLTSSGKPEQMPVDRSEAVYGPSYGLGLEEVGKSIADLEQTSALAMPKQERSTRFGLEPGLQPPAAPAAPAPVELRVEPEAGGLAAAPGMGGLERNTLLLRERPQSLPSAEARSAVRDGSVPASHGSGVGGGAGLGLIAETERGNERPPRESNDTLSRGIEPRGEPFFHKEGEQVLFDMVAENRRAPGPDSVDTTALDSKDLELGDRPTLGRFFEAQDGTTTWAAGANVATAGPLTGNVSELDVNGAVSLERYENKIQVGQVVMPSLVTNGASSSLYFISGGGVSAGYPLPETGEPEVRQKAVALVGPEPQPEVQAAEQPVSTFSLNVSDVSFKLAAASLENGVIPEPSTIRTEEFINAFDYGDPEPAPGSAVALAWERARYPFAHNRDLLRLSVRTAAQGRAQDRPLNLVLLLDSSGSMERADRVGIIREAMRVLAAQLQPQDRVSVVSFARTPRLWVDGLAGADAARLPELVGELAPEGGTNLEEALGLAYETAARHFVAGGVNRVVLLTDGAANLGDVEPQSLQVQVQSNRLRNIALDCFGIGWDGYNDDLLEVLSRHGDGRYGFVNTPEDAATGFADQLAGALQIAAANVKVQVEFNPARVTAYRQIGYAKHQLTEEQFRDDTVDAAEIAAAESGNALYVAQIEPQGQGPIGIVRARYQDPANGDVHEREWVLPYLGAAPVLGVASATLRLAGVAAAFGEWLGRSPFAGEVTTDQLLQLLGGVPEAFEPDPRPQQLRRMIFQGMTLAGGSTN